MRREEQVEESLNSIQFAGYLAKSSPAHRVRPRQLESSPARTRHPNQTSVFLPWLFRSTFQVSAFLSKSGFRAASFAKPARNPER